MPSRAPSVTPNPEAADQIMANTNPSSENVQHELGNMQGQLPPALPIEDDLMGLARLGELRAVQKLFDGGKYTATHADEQGITALHVCYFSSHHYRLLANTWLSGQRSMDTTHSATF